jgi:hypothetical protein
MERTSREVRSLNQMSIMINEVRPGATAPENPTLADVGHPKHPDDARYNGIGFYYGVATVTPVSTPSSIRQDTGSRVEAAKQAVGGH